MQRAIVGTAGHIDHGKTSLVLALTGIDCDRWAEEKARGITIDLGFAHLTAGGVQLGFVDVPGHERFLHNALAGLGGIRVMLLVVAADEGVKPQTREHLAICSLLGIPAGLVALTKSDLVTPDLLELAHLEIDDLLAATPFAGATVLDVSSTTGAGVAALKTALLALAARHSVAADPQQPARLPLDRAFHLRGLGVVVTGTLAGGRLRTGDLLELLPAVPAVDGTLRVRSIQVHGEPRDEALAGERTSLQLTGAALDDLRRGQQLGTPGAFAATTRLLARCSFLADAASTTSAAAGTVGAAGTAGVAGVAGAAKSAGATGAGFVPVRLHLQSGEALGRLRRLAATAASAGPGEPAGAASQAAGGELVEIRLQSPIVAVRGDRIILRRPSPATTLGGGVVLDPAWRRHRGTRLRQSIGALGGEDEAALAFWVLEAGEGGLDAAGAARRLGIPAAQAAERLAQLAVRAKLLEVPEAPGHGRVWIAPEVVRRVTERARRVLADFFAKDRLAEGMSKAEAARRILRGRAVALAPVYLAWLAAQKVLAVQGDQVVLPGRSAQLSGEESALSAAIMERFDRAALAPPSPGEVRQELGAKPQILEGVMRHLVARGRLVRLPGGLMVSAAAVAEMRRQLLASGWERFSVPQFKDHFGLTRKWAIPLLEHLDGSGVTRRLGDDRQVVRAGAAAAKEGA